MNPSQVSELVARHCKPELFSKPDHALCHVGLTAFPHVSQTLCGLRFSDLERVPNKNVAPYMLCDKCVHQLGMLTARFIT